MDIQTEVQKIHHQFGVTEKANYEIQKLFDKAIKEAVTEALSQHDVSGRSEQLCQHSWVKHPSHPKIGSMVCLRCGAESA